MSDYLDVVREVRAFGGEQAVADQYTVDQIMEARDYIDEKMQTLAVTLAKLNKALTIKTGVHHAG